MKTQLHTIGRLSFTTVVEDPTTAFALRTRIETLAWDLLPGVIERLCDALVPPDVYLVIDRLDLDLGVIREQTLEEDGAAALERSLAQALAAAIARARMRESSGIRLQSTNARRLQALSAFLQEGIAQRENGGALIVAEHLGELIRSCPEALASMLRALASNRRALQRVALHLDAEQFRELLSLLAPAEADEIASLLDDVVRVHRRKPIERLVALGEPELTSVLRVATLEYLLRDAGSEFNRRTFLEFLLKREATHAGVSYATLLRTLRGALNRARVRRPLPPTLEKITRLVSDLDAAPAQHEDEALVAALTSRLGDDRFNKSVRALPASAFARIVFTLAPRRAAALLSDVNAITARNISAQLALGRRELQALARELALRYLLRSGENVNRYEFIRALTHGIARTIALRGETSGRLTRQPSENLERSDAIEAVIHKMLPLQRTAPLNWIGADDFEQLVRRLTSEYLDEHAFDADGLSEHLAHRLTEGSRSWALAIETFANDGVLPLRSDRRVHVEHFLRTGQPRAAGRALADSAEEDRIWLAALVRRIARESPAHVPELIARLLDWLYPQELVAVFAADRALEIPSLCDRVGAGAGAWSAYLEYLLTDERREPPRARERTAAWLDHLALISYWLEHGRLPPWSPSGLTAARLLAELPERSHAELTWLFLGASRAITLGRLERVARLHPSILTRLAPWMAPNAPREAVLRAAASALSGEDISLQPPQRFGDVAARERLFAWLDGAPVSPQEEAALADLFADLVDACDAHMLAHLHSHRADANARKRWATMLSVERFGRLLSVLADLDTEPEQSVEPLQGLSGPAARERLFAWLDGAAVSPQEEVALARLFAELTDARDAQMLLYLDAHASNANARKRWTSVLPVEAFGRLVTVLAPAGARSFLGAALVIAAAWRQIAPFGAARPDEREIWKTMLDIAIAPGRFDLASALEQVMTRITGSEARHTAALRARAEHLIRDGGHVAVAAALRRAPAARASQPADPHKPAPRTALEPPTRALYVENAGLVLTAPFLPTLFERLRLLENGPGEEKRLAPGLENASRAVHFLQYLADGRLNCPEPELVLNKVLCGLPVAQPIQRGIEPRDGELAICDGLLQAVRSNWPPLLTASMEALRGEFFQRKGKLEHRDGTWRLQVERRTIDVLMQQLPWGFSVIYHPWMTSPLHVTW